MRWVSVYMGDSFRWWLVAGGDHPRPVWGWLVVRRRHEDDAAVEGHGLELEDEPLAVLVGPDHADPVPEALAALRVADGVGDVGGLFLRVVDLRVLGHGVLLRFGFGPSPSGA